MDRTSTQDSLEPALLAAGIALSQVPELHIVAVEFPGHEIRMILDSGDVLAAPPTASVDMLLALLESTTGVELPRRFDPALPFPAEPLDEQTKWIELLRDLGEGKSILTGMRPGAGYVRVARSGSIAEVACSWQGLERAARFDLADGTLPVGLGDELAELFAT